MLIIGAALFALVGLLYWGVTFTVERIYAQPTTAPPTLPGHWEDSAGTGISIVLTDAGTGTVTGFLRTPEGQPCRTENYERFDADVTWHFTDSGSIRLSVGEQTHVMFPRREPAAEIPWDTVRVDLCGAERQGGDFRPFVRVD